MNGSIDKAAFRELVQTQQMLHRDMAVEDWYKLFHQAVFGGGHRGLDPDAILDSIRHEWGRGERPVAGERLLEFVDTESSVLRVNIRLYEKSGGTPETLAEVFLKSWTDFHPEVVQMHDLGEQLAALAHEIAGLEADSVRQYWQLMQGQAFPAQSHSFAYRLANRPAYRVVRKVCWPPFDR